MAIPTVYHPSDHLSASTRITIGGDEAHHLVRVLRLVVGNPLRIADGRGTIASATIDLIRKDRDSNWYVECQVTATEAPPPVRPRLHVFAPPPKGDCLPQMIDSLSQIGAVAWTPIISARTVVSPREGKLDRLQRITPESVKQCGRATLMELNPPEDFNPCFTRLCASTQKVIVAHAPGERPIKHDFPEVALFIGPEGGWSDRELETIAAAGVARWQFGPHIMRVETAAPVAGACIIELGH